ncbi:hypothetical protein [Adhaeribacter pallidiroseus]|uniref:hypothetical protein n=1 Tax=Adhaeribacter pallidiroseus TaxID=2072847 RepID=UPI001313E88B|nr:hypothetical protein [Adhaeribacter pallidiroseus]
MLPPRASSLVATMRKASGRANGLTFLKSIAAGKFQSARGRTISITSVDARDRYKFKIT